MNIQQMKASIAKFRKADLSVIKDEKLRAQGQKLQGKEKGFTLLELLVVITLIAILATGALIAYEDVGENAEAASAGNAAATLDRAIRTYRAVENVYPNQWDLLVEDQGSGMQFSAPIMNGFLAAWEFPTSANGGDTIATAFLDSGIEELQMISAGTALPPNIAPNRFHNESTGPAGTSFEAEFEESDEYPSHLSVVPNANCADVAASEPTNYPAAAFDGTPATSNIFQNRYGDALEADECHALVALGFGGDAAASTTFSNVAISQSPTYVRNTGNEDTEVNPEIHYARYIGLFALGQYADENGEIGDGGTEVWTWYDKPQLVTIVTPDGKNIDQLTSEAQQ
ncbi:type II secretion system protein [uncultured Methylophaga sp.]|uniref:type II secretion system protein n=1 Tax=uncultured Methylophaga sp. TaxID=285271 RepID=UPI0026168D1C|nr:type II secretion system protein [uncultured Methylophaga sp.]